MTSISSVSKEQLLPNSSNANQPFVILTDSSNESLPKQTPTIDMKRPPLKDVRNTKISDIAEKKCSTKFNVSQKEQLLNKVKLQWTTGKGRHQTPQCLDTIRECLKNDIPRDEINAAIVSEMRGEAQVIESRRAESYMLRARKSKTVKGDVNQVAPIQFPFQRNGCLYYKDEDGSKVCRVVQQSDPVATITPSNSSEEADTISDAIDMESGMRAHLTTLLGHSSVKDETELVEMSKEAKSDVNASEEIINEESDEEVKVEQMSEIESKMEVLGI